MSPRRNEIRWNGQTHRIIERLQVCRQRFYVVQTYSRHNRVRMKAFQELGGGRLSLRTIHFFPKNAANRRTIAAFLAFGHANFPVPRVFFSDETKAELRLVTEWIEGQSLSKYLNQVKAGKRPGISPYEAIRIYRSLVHQICAYNKKGLIHGDISSGNLILTATRNHRLSLIDFGSAFFETQSNRHLSNDGFASAFAAPEVIRGASSNLLTEQFSATMVLFLMIRLQIAYDHIGGQAGLISHHKQPTLELSNLFTTSTGIPSKSHQQTVEIIRRGLSLEPERRFQSACEWRHAVDSVFRGFVYFPNTRPPNQLAKTIRWIQGKISSRQS